MEEKRRKKEKSELTCRDHYFSIVGYSTCIERGNGDASLQLHSCRGDDGIATTTERKRNGEEKENRGKGSDKEKKGT